MKRRLDDIVVGPRFRRNLGHINGLARSIEELGLLHPIPIQPDGTLIAGARRLAAVKLLGWTEIAVNVVDLDGIPRGEFAENAHRKDFTPSELIAIGQELERIEGARAKARMIGAHASPGNLPEQDKGDTRDKIAAQLGISGRTYEKAREVCRAAEQCPEKFAAIKDQMDASGNVDRAFKQARIIARQEEYAKSTEHSCTVDDLVALAESGQRFGVILADPPWTFATWSEKGKGRSAENHFGTSSIDQITTLPVAALAADNCALLLWVTGPLLAVGAHLAVIAAWGFTPATIAFTWVKTNTNGSPFTGLGYYTRSNAEICVLATKGSPSRLANDVRQVVPAPVGEHSAKPEEVRNRIERLFPGPYLELYARKPAPNWTVWGNEIPRADFATAAIVSDAIDTTVPSEAPPDDELEIPPGLRRVAE